MLSHEADQIYKPVPLTSFITDMNLFSSHCGSFFVENPGKPVHHRSFLFPALFLGDVEDNYTLNGIWIVMILPLWFQYNVFQLWIALECIVQSLFS